ncbi:MAG: TOTE conflict system archaeo-eukaryotic primase domain-containing protein, partial [Cetobacterium sp.]
QEKIKIFSELFLGRKDVYAKRWKNKLGKSGYSPVCKNEWDYNLCDKLKRGCSNCQNKKYLPIDNKIIESHLRGEIVVGIYPLLKDETCNFIAIDFDKKDWESSIKSLYLVCKENKIDALIERSRSGNGGHLWIFFSESVSASIARKLATGLINKAMCKNNNLSFDSYDRIFPNQDTMPKGNLGNLIALPLQKEARQKNNSVFVNEDFIPYQNQWEKLRSIQKLSLEEIQNKIYEFSEEDNFMIDNQIIGKFKNEDSRNLNLEGNEFPLKVKIIKRNSLYVDKLGFSSKAINIIRRLAIFKNPEFYKFQAMRMSTYGKPRVINCSEEDERYIILPRGCEEKLFKLLKEQKSEIQVIDNRGLGRKINVSFKGKLYLEQKKAFEMMSYCEIGVLSATTAFGKTVVAASLIAKKGVSTLILVHRQQLLDQWKVRMEEFLEIKEEKPK